MKDLTENLENGTKVIINSIGNLFGDYNLGNCLVENIKYFYSWCGEGGLRDYLNSQDLI